MDQQVLLTFSAPLSNPSTMKVLQPIDPRMTTAMRPSSIGSEPGPNVVIPVVPPPPPGFINSQGGQEGKGGGAAPAHDGGPSAIGGQMPDGVGYAGGAVNGG